MKGRRTVNHGRTSICFSVTKFHNNNFHDRILSVYEILSRFTSTRDIIHGTIQSIDVLNLKRIYIACDFIFSRGNKPRLHYHEYKMSRN